MRHTTIIIFVFAAAAASALRRLEGATVLITTPSPYAARLKSALHAQGAAVVHLEAVRTELLHGGDQRKLRRALLIDHRNGDYVAFTSRRGIQGARRACGSQLTKAFTHGDKPFLAIALGADADALVACGVPHERVLVPRVASPAGIVAMLRARVPRAQRAATTVLCPVPRVVGLTEPPVVPRFLRALRRAGFGYARVDAYETRWPGAGRAARAATARLAVPGAIDAIAVTSTAEVEGLQRYCALYGVGLRRAAVPLVAHGPVTAGGARARRARRRRQPPIRLLCGPRRCRRRAVHAPARRRGAARARRLAVAARLTPHVTPGRRLL